MTESGHLAAELAHTYAELRAGKRADWQRDLPFDELLFDRWERAASLGFGNGTSVYHLSYFFGEVTVGEDCWIGPYTLIDGSGGGVRIGSNVTVSAGVHVYTHDTVAHALSGGRLPPVHGRVEIGDCSYIGPGSIISLGVTIGDHVVIGAGSFVNRDVPPYSVAAGTPCRVIGRVELEGDEVRLVYEHDRGGGQA